MLGFIKTKWKYTKTSGAGFINILATYVPIPFILAEGCLIRDVEPVELSNFNYIFRTVVQQSTRVWSLLHFLSCLLAHSLVRSLRGSN